MSPRYALLGLARPGARWFADVARWATSAALPLEFTKCVSADEVRTRLASGRRWSALLVDGAALGVDRDLLAEADGAGVVTIVIDDDPPRRAWTELGAVAVMAPDLDPAGLLASLDVLAEPIERIDGADPVAPGAPAPWQGRLVAVTGVGGAGVSTVAAGLAQGLADDVRERGLVLLADLSLQADQAVLHHTGDVVPGLPELIDAHRLGTPGPLDVRSLTFALPDRHYDLLLGVRRHRDWTLLRRSSTAAALAGIRGAYRTVVAETDPDVEGVADTGSHDVEDRNLLARTVTAEADLVVVVTRADVTGVHRAARLLGALADHDVEPDRLVVVANRAARPPSARAELAEALRDLTGLELPDIVHLPERRAVAAAARDGGPVPTVVARALAAAVRSGLGAAGAARGVPRPERVRPGTLGSRIGGAS